MFTPSVQRRAYQNVVAQIEDAILDGRLNPGDKLPGERDLIQMFQICRGTLREALRSLEQKRLITVKTGANGGVVVLPLSTKFLGENLQILLRYQKISLKELSEFRASVEGLVAGQAAQKARKADIKNLQSLLIEIRKSLESPRNAWDEVVSKEKQFHACLSKIAGNRLFEIVLGTIYDNIQSYFDRYFPKDRAVLERSCHDLSEILKAIEKKDSAHATTIAKQHVQAFYEIMSRRVVREKGLLRTSGIKDSFKEMGYGD